MVHKIASKPSGCICNVWAFSCKVCAREAHQINKGRGEGRMGKEAHRMKLACLNVRLTRLCFKDKSTAGYQSFVDALEKAPQADVAPI